MAIPDIAERDIKWLKGNVGQPNIASEFEQTTLDYIGSDIVALVDIDRSSRSAWLEACEKGEKIAMQEREEKSFPWPNAANVKDPLMPVAMMQFAARAGAEVVRGIDVVKSHVTGEDPDGIKEKRAKRVSVAMSYQCLTQMTEWMPGTDQLLSSMSGYGMYYKKTYYDPSLGRNVSLACSPRKIIVHNDAIDLESAERVTHEFECGKNKVIERIRGGQWEDIESKLSQDEDTRMERFYECHCWYDLDGDGYKEPYIITAHADSGAIARIVARYEESGINTNKKGIISKIEAEHCITEFPFLPSPDGKFHKMGFFKLLGPLNEEINTVQNQLIDAGTFQNSPPIFVGRGAKLPSGNFRAAPGKFINVESTGAALRDNIFIPPAAGASQVLFNLLARLDDKGMKLASVSETMMGDTPQANVPATTTLAILDQGLKVFSSVLKRLYRAFEQEFRKLYKLNYLYMDDDEYIHIIDITAQELIDLGINEHLTPDGKVAPQKGIRRLVEMDFNMSDCDIQPVMDPTAASEAIRLARAQAIFQTDPGNPAVKRYFYQVLGVPDRLIDEFVPKQMPPDPKSIMAQAQILQMEQQGHISMQKLKNESAKLAVQELETSYRMMLLEAQTTQANANAELALANSDKVQVEMQLAGFQAHMDQINAQFHQDLSAVKLMLEREANVGTNNAANGSGGTEDVAKGQENEEGSGVPETEAAGSNAGLAGGELPEGISGGSGGMDTNNVSAGAGVQPHATTRKLASLEAGTPMM